MNNTEIYFARQNMIYDISLYFIITIAAILILGYIGAWVYDNWLEGLIDKIKEKKKGKENGRK